MKSNLLLSAINDVKYAFYLVLCNCVRTTEKLQRKCGTSGRNKVVQIFFLKAKKFTLRLVCQ